MDAVKEAHEKGQPVLVGTITIETSELLSGMLKREGIPHTVLNAKFHEKEAEIVANPIAKQVLALEEKYAAMPDADLQAQTAVFKQQLADGKTTDDILPDAFAVCREAAWRVLGMKHFPVQVIGGIALHRGDISEMQ